MNKSDFLLSINFKLSSRKGNTLSNCEFFFIFVFSVRGSQKPLLPVTHSTNPGFVSRTYCFAAFYVDVPFTFTSLFNGCFTAEPTHFVTVYVNA